MKMKYSVLLAIALTGVSVLSAQEEKKEVAYVGVIALGDKAELKYKRFPKQEELEKNGKANDGEPILQAIKKDQTRPAALYIQNANGKKVSMRVGVRGMPHFVKVRAGRAIKTQRKVAREKSELESYLDLPSIRANSRTLVFLQPLGKANAPWKGVPKVSLLDVDTPTFKQKQLIVKNATKKDLKMKIGAQVHHIKAGNTIGVSQKKMQKNAQYKGSTSYQNFVVAEVQDQSSIAARATLRMVPNRKNLLVLYPINPKLNGGKSIGYFTTPLYLPELEVVHR